MRLICDSCAPRKRVLSTSDELDTGLRIDREIRMMILCVCVIMMFFR